MHASEITNQPPPVDDYNAYDTDVILMKALHREGGGGLEDKVRALGQIVTSREVAALARCANRFAPQLRREECSGPPIDVVEFHPAYHRLMALAFGAEVHSLAWTAKQPGGHAARAALSFLWNQAENGVSCPAGMTFAAVVALRKQPEIEKIWEPRVLSSQYDDRVIPVANKTGATIGQTLTERHCGSDLRAIKTQARALGRSRPGSEYELSGHKWFCSAPMSDAFFTLAMTERGPSCFFVPRFRSDGRPNRIVIERLKDKCGNRSNATAEITFDHAWGLMVGEEGRGVGVMLEMTHLIRFDFAVGSAGLLHGALVQALHYAAHRRAFGGPLIERPLMRNVLTDLALESEAATTLAFRLARAFDGAATDDAERLLTRIVTPLAKYWICKRAVVFVAESLECLGGNGYIEDSAMARLYREAPLNAIWEGTSNMVCLDVFRVIRRESSAVDAYVNEVGRARSGDRRLDQFIDRFGDKVRSLGEAEWEARRMAETMAVALQASLLIRHAPSAVADAFCDSRLGSAGGRAFGTLPDSVLTDQILARAEVKVP